MSSTSSNRKWLATGLGTLQVFVGIGAVPSGISMIHDPSGRGLGMPLEILRNTPFTTFLVPGVVLLMVNGLGSLMGGGASLFRYRFAGEVAVGLGTLLMLWIGAQVWWMEVHWLHVLYFVLGLVELLLGWGLRGYFRTASQDPPR